MRQRGLSVRSLEPGLWPDLERLFGENGACGGCWCMWWRVPRGGRLWMETKGPKAKKMFRRLVSNGKARGALAYDGDTPVGWCAVGPRAEFPRTERTKAYRRDDLDGVWSVNCFFVARTHRGRGVARALLDAAVKEAKRGGARIVEGYPVPVREAQQIPAVFAYTGPLPIFEEAGFEVVQRLAPSRPLVRLRVKR